MGLEELGIWDLSVFPMCGDGQMDGRELETEAGSDKQENKKRREACLPLRQKGMTGCSVA